MKLRRHHNNNGERQIRTGRTVEQVKRMARRLGVPYAKAQCPTCGGPRPRMVAACKICGERATQ